MSTYRLDETDYSVYGTGKTARYNSLIESFYRTFDNLSNRAKTGYNYYGSKYGQDLGHKLEGYVKEYGENGFNGELRHVTNSNERDMITRLEGVYRKFSFEPCVGYTIFTCPEGTIYDAYDGCCYYKDGTKYVPET